MIPISSVMTKEVICVKKDTHINRAIELLINNKISGLPVVDDEHRIVGILSEKDLLCCAVTCNVRDNDVVEKYMSHDVHSFDISTDAMEVCRFLMDHYFRRVPITQEGKLVGVISRRDILVFILDACSKMSDNRYS